MSLTTVPHRLLASTAVAVVACQALVVTGAVATTGDIILVSASATGEPGNGLSSFGVCASANGRYVAFASMATNLEPSDHDTVVDIFVKDLETGAVHLASQTADGVKGDTISLRPSISADGQRVAFTSAATNLSPDDTDGYFDIFVKDLQTGAVTVASRTTDGTKANGSSSAAAISGDGSTVAFSSNATNLSPDATDGESHVYVKRLDTGTLTLVDGGTIARPDEQIGATGPSLSADGVVVAFATDAAGLEPTDTDRVSDVYARNLASGSVTLVSVNAAGVKGDLPSRTPSLSADGSRVAFETFAANLTPADPDTLSDVYVKNLADASLHLVSTDVAGVKANKSAGYPSLSADGGFVAFSSDATNLGIDTPPLVNQVYRKDLATGVLLPASVSTDRGPAGDYLSIDPSITADGAVVAFVSPSTNLAPDGGNRVADVFAKQFLPQAPPDLAPPTELLATTPAKLAPHSGDRTVTITGSAQDDRGIDRITISVSDEYGVRQPVVAPVEGEGRTSVAWQRSAVLSTWLCRGDAARIYRVTAVAADLAGNTTSVTVSVVVRRTSTSLASC